ncbi:uncharacterized protein LOC118452534 [Egretta garzetta]|uniref:uncharacterized protein LOC118452534 n=1 Tax=Egretta garzetta TaxID=188379 RepID=UPI00163CCB57|nr:uncharacterized protein LOC118452534 [Egretta garzetta]XP_035752616.1 uncharacterized protein LOC118452534 [Egretta garzetta]
MNMCHANYLCLTQSYLKTYNRFLLIIGVLINLANSLQGHDNMRQRSKRSLELEGHEHELPIWDPEENLWEELATKVVNTSNFCLHSSNSVSKVFTSCLVGVPTPLRTLKHYQFQYNGTSPTGETIQWEVSNTTCLQHQTRLPTGEILCWAIARDNLQYNETTVEALGKVSQEFNRKMFKVRIGNSFPAESCIKFVNCSKNCLNLSRSKPILHCNQTYDMSTDYKHTILPQGWFLLCGRMAYTYIPANCTGGPCSLGRLVPRLYRPADIMRQERRSRRSIHSLGEECDAEVTLFSPEEISAAAFLAPGAGVAMNYNVMKRLACALVKNINYTSQALSVIQEELSQIRQAALENRAAIDYLLLRHNHGCKEFKGMCCFNLTGNLELIESKTQNLKQSAHGIKERQGLDLSWLTNWLPNLIWVKQIFIAVILIIVIILVIYVLMQCIPMIRNLCDSKYRRSL